jgi:hypothetical protein
MVCNSEWTKQPAVKVEIDPEVVSRILEDARDAEAKALGFDLDGDDSENKQADEEDLDEW